jgi:predicted RNase H-like HicB family nuclease
MSTPTLYCSFQARVEEVDGEWTAIEEGLGLSAHGATVEHATTRLSQAINVMVDTLLEHGGIDAVKARLNRAGLVFTVAEAEDQPIRRTMPLMLSLAKSLERA